MNLRDLTPRLIEHAFAADEATLAALDAAPSAPLEARCELLHVLAVEELWLARVEGRAPAVEVWPDPDATDARALLRRVRDGWRRLLADLDDLALSRSVDYRTSRGDRFSNTVADILLQVATHGQYHRGRVNLRLRDAGASPAPLDYIGYVRGAPAATTDRRPRTTG